MVANYILKCLRNLVFKEAEEAHLPLIIIIVLGIISVVIAECFFAYFVFLTLKDFFDYPIEVASISTAGVFGFQAGLFLYYSYYLSKKATKGSFFIKRYNDLKEVTNAFGKGFKKKVL